MSLLTPVAVRAEDPPHKAPSFRLNDISGRSVALDDFTGNVVLVNFWTTWCRSCREELSELERLYHRFREKDLVVIGIIMDASAEQAAAFLRKRPAAFPVLLDTRGFTADAYRISGLPAGFLIGRNGVIERRYRGSAKELISRYEKDIEELLQRK